MLILLLVPSNESASLYVRYATSLVLKNLLSAHVSFPILSKSFLIHSICYHRGAHNKLTISIHGFHSMTKPRQKSSNFLSYQSCSDTQEPGTYASAVVSAIAVVELP